MPNKIIKKSFSGTVLIMVITITFLIILMLLASLTVVSTARNRTYTKYEENQAYYTARSALDVFVDNLIEDEQYYAYKNATTVRQFEYTNSSGTGTSSANMMQGLALELELYKLVAQNSNEIWANITPTGSNAVFTTSPEINNFAIASSANASNYNKNTPDTYALYQVTLPALSETVGSETFTYGKFADLQSGKQLVEIKVEVLERIYSTGDKYTLAELEDMKTIDGTTISNAEVAAAIVLGKRHEDYMRVKITATTEYAGVEGVAAVEIENYVPETTPPSDAMSATGQIEITNGTKLTVYGGTSTTGNIRANFEGAFFGGLFTEGDYSCTNSGVAFPLYENEVFYVGGDYTWSDKNPIVAVDVNDSKKRPLVYVGGTYGEDKSNFHEVDTNSDTLYNATGNQDVSWGNGDRASMDHVDEKYAVDLVCHGYVDKNRIAHNGNILCIGNMDLSKDNNTSLDVYNGVVIVIGDLILNDNASWILKDFGGTFYVTGDCRLPTSCFYNDSSKKAENNVATLMPDLEIYADSFSTSSADGGVATEVAAHASQYSLTKGGTSLRSLEDLARKSSALGENVDTATDFKKLDVATKIKIELPDLFTSTSKQIRELPTHLTIYGKYYKPVKSNPDKFLIKERRGEGAAGMNKPTEYYTFSATEEAAGRVPAAEGRTGDEYVKMDFDPYNQERMPDTKNPPDTAGGDWTEWGKFIKDGIDCGPSEIENWYLQPSIQYHYNNGTNPFVIKGGGIVNVFLTPGTYAGNYFLIKDDTTVNFYFDDEKPSGGIANYEWTLPIVTEEVMNLANSGTSFEFGSTTNIAPPKVRYFISNDAHEEAHKINPSSQENMIFQSSDRDLLFVGYMYAPDTSVGFHEGMGSVNPTVKYNGIQTSTIFDHNIPTEAFSIIGSITAKHIYTGNQDKSFAYVDPLSTEPAAGEPLFVWQRTLYTRY